MRTKFWTKKEIELLLEVYAQGQPRAAIARLLGRSEQSIDSKIRDLRRAGVGPARRWRPFHKHPTNRAHPVIRQIMKTAAREGYTSRILEKRSGVSRDVIAKLTRANTSFNSIVAIAQAMGLQLTVQESDV